MFKRGLGDSSRPPLQKKRGREPLRPHATKGAIITGE
jgi:hypothetical protein